jgi:hypothetical protein
MTEEVKSSAQDGLAQTNTPQHLSRMQVIRPFAEPSTIAQYDRQRLDSSLFNVFIVSSTAPSSETGLYFHLHLQFRHRKRCSLQCQFQRTRSLDPLFRPTMFLIRFPCPIDPTLWIVLQFHGAIKLQCAL